MESEAGVNEVIKTPPVTAMCQYDANRFSGATIFEALRVHPYMVMNGQLVRNPYYAAVLHDLVAAGTVMSSYTETEKLLDFVEAALRSVPGVASCWFEMGANELGETSVSNGRDGGCQRCLRRTGSPGDRSPRPRVWSKSG